MSILWARKLTVFTLVVSSLALIDHTLIAVADPTLHNISRLGGTFALVTLGAMWMYATNPIARFLKQQEVA